ncbi:hypothetical protein [Tanticharoenia sakaeratensis]|uniref:hypothetical protein n=1 Tax=Tanticharoenia sakaeratensis TaxID=444053 RepID=UPI0006628517|nr:hypothetical protein [Tanticharoenia sakaeratensis]
MLSSTIIEIDGIFLGAAILLGPHGRRRFYAAHDRVRALHNVVMPDLGHLHVHVAAQFRKNARQDPASQV